MRASRAGSAQAPGTGGSGRAEAQRVHVPLKAEVAALALVLAGAAVLRLLLAARGWPAVDSDEATMGLMADDVLFHGAHPVFFYGQQYMGALQAYLGAPVFAVLGPTSFALRVVTTLQVLLALGLVYLLGRAIYSPVVAWCSVTLLALGPGNSLFHELRAGVGTQDTLVFGSALLLVTYWRLQRPASRLKPAILDLAIGLAIGLGVWADLLILPFAASACLTLIAAALVGCRPYVLRALRSGAATAALIVAGIALGGAPLWIANLHTGGATFKQVLTISTAGAGAAEPHSGVLGHLFSLAQQVGATALVGLPHLLGSTVVCPDCALWPRPRLSIGAADLVRELVFAAPFTVAAGTLWLIETGPLVRTAWNSLAGRKAQHPEPAASMLAERTPFDARWWGHVMMSLGAALVVLEYAASRISYASPGTSDRYLVGLYVFTPLVVAPLVRGVQRVWTWLCAQRELQRGSAGGRLAPPPVGALLGVVVLAVALVVNLAGASMSIAAASDASSYAVPAPPRDQHVLEFLKAHQAIRFYTTYWACGRLMFESGEQVVCAVVNDADPLRPGVNRIAANSALLATTPHPAYVFDLLEGKVQPGAPDEIASLKAGGDARFLGYADASFDGFRVFYYRGSA